MMMKNKNINILVMALPVIMAGVLLINLYGCSGSQGAVRVTLPLETGDKLVLLHNVAASTIIDDENFYELYLGIKSENVKNTEKNITATVFKNSLAVLQLNNKFVPFIFTGNEARPLKPGFDRERGVFTLNGKPFAISAGNEASFNWTMQRKPEDLAGIRTVFLCGRADRDIPVLKKFNGKDLTVVIGKSFKGELSPETAQALAALQPYALAALKPVGLEKSLAALTGLRHLVLVTRNAPEVSGLVNLKYLAVCFRGEGKKTVAADFNLASLKNLASLESLYVGGIESLDVSPLAAMPALRHLSLHRMKTLQEPASLQRLKLSSLTLFEVMPVNASLLATMSSVTYLVLGDNDIENLDSLKKMKQLRVLVVNKKYLKNEYGLHKSLPDTDIQGFCLGSLWIIPMLVTALATGMIMRKRRGAMAS